MKYIDEYRDEKLVKGISARIRKLVTRSWTIMEVCGGQTHSILRFGLEELLPQEIRLVHGPGCPVCVTPLELIDKAIALAAHGDVILASYGDMMRVPGSTKDLLTAKAEGGDIRIVYSPLDAVSLAAENPSKKVVFFAIGFETTAPANALAIVEAERKKLPNFFILSSHVLVPPAMRAILESPLTGIHAFLAAGHVCTVMGYWEYIPIADKYRVPIVITGFEPVDILRGILLAVEQLEQGSHGVVNAYGRAVRPEGNPGARQVLDRVFGITDRKWRGIGTIPSGGLALREEYRRFDAETAFSLGHIEVQESAVCIAGEILQGLKKPSECIAFGKECLPEHPLGAPMVSAEGACSAYYRYKKGNTIE